MDKQYYLFAGDDIYEDNQRIYLKDELIGNITILKKTKNIKKLLPEGVYYISNKTNNQEIYVEERLEDWQYFENILLMRNYLSIDVKVTNSINQEVLEGIHCGLFAYNDIYDQNNCLVYLKDDLVMDFYTNHHLIKVPLLNINEGTFYIQQLNTIEGYYGNTQQYLIQLSQKEHTITIENQPTRVNILKKDQHGNYIKGVWLALYDEKGYLVDEWITNKEHTVFCLAIGHRYTIEELYTPKQYKKKKTISFIVENSQSIQKITIINERESIH